MIWVFWVETDCFYKTPQKYPDIFLHENNILFTQLFVSIGY